MITETDGWPGVFEDAIAALWNSPPHAAPGRIMIQHSPSQTVSQKVAASVVENLHHLRLAFQSKFVGNIIQNIQLAASYLSIMTLVRSPSFSSCATHIFIIQGMIDSPMDKDFAMKLNECLTRAAYVFPISSWLLTDKCPSGHSHGDGFDILKTLGLTLVQFQAPLFCCLAISPIILFRTCSIVTSRFGRHHYLPVCHTFSLIVCMEYSLAIVTDESWRHQTGVIAGNRIIHLETFIPCRT